MQRNLTPATIKELYQESSVEGYVVFLDIHHPALSETIYICSDDMPFMLNGHRYEGAPFEISLLNDNDDMPTATMKVQNIDRRIGMALESINSPARIDIRVVAFSEFNLTVSPRTQNSDPATMIYEALFLFLTDVTCTVFDVTGKIVSWNYLQEPYPGMRATKDRCPGLHR